MCMTLTKADSVKYCDSKINEKLVHCCVAKWCLPVFDRLLRIKHRLLDHLDHQKCVQILSIKCLPPCLNVDQPCYQALLTFSLLLLYGNTDPTVVACTYRAGRIQSWLPAFMVFADMQKPQCSRTTFLPEVMIVMYTHIYTNTEVQACHRTQCNSVLCEHRLAETKQCV